MATEPDFDLGVLVGAVIVHDSVDVLPGGNLTFDGVEEEANELLMAVLLHAAADYRAIEDVGGGKQGRGPMSLVAVVRGATLPGLSGRPGWVGSSA
ncbi:MAG: hypothetical protein EOO77_00100 [Oxalobacteraceae bacterium]|nr:MAG: hypothetical protein EOO77_00100 [Oxalobacteraceae bacterium]